MRVLITGYGGFAGGHLAEALLAETAWRLWGTVHPAGTPPEVGVAAGVEALPVDLRDAAALRGLVDRVAPDLIFHLAGQAFVPQAWADPWGTFETNVRMQINLLEAVAARADGRRDTRVIAVSSNEVYGSVPLEEQPIDEGRPMAPANPYATSKAAQDLVAGQYHRALGLDVVRIRPFNHVGPRQDARFVLPAFARQVAEIEAGLRPPLLAVGNLEAERDFSDVRDIVRGYHLAAVNGRGGEVYNLGSGQPRPIRSLVETLLDLAEVAIEVVTEPGRLRPSDTPVSCCDSGKAQRELGWAPRIPFRQTVAEVLDEWRARVRAAAPASL